MASTVLGSRFLIFLQRHKVAVLISIIALEVLLRIFHVPQRIAWIPKWSNYDQVVIRKVLGPFVPYKYMPGEYMTFKDDGLHGTRCNNRDCSTPPFDTSIRVLCLGGSTAWGAGVSDEETYPSQLEKTLNSDSDISGRTFAVFNYGIPGTTSYYGANKTIFDAESLDPDIAVMGYGGINDCLEFHFHESELGLFSPWRRLLRSSQIYQLIEHTLYRFVYYPTAKPRLTTEEYEQNINIISNFYLSRGKPVIFLTEWVVDPDHANMDGFLSGNLMNLTSLLTRVAESTDAPLVNSKKCLGAGEEQYFLQDGVHWNERGCGRIAECVAAEIRSLYSVQADPDHDAEHDQDEDRYHQEEQGREVVPDEKF